MNNKVLFCIEWEDDQGGSFLRHIHTIRNFDDWKTLDDQLWCGTWIHAIFEPQGNPNEIEKLWWDNQDSLVQDWYASSGNEMGYYKQLLKVKSLAEILGHVYTDESLAIKKYFGE